MSGNTFGKLFNITTFGESHGEALGAIIDGVPAKLPFNIEQLQTYLDRRRPGSLKAATSRNEADQVEVLSGIFEGKTLGTPITLIVRNQDAKSSDYDKLKNQYRPGHADKTYELKYGHRDHRGGGRSSGRETLSRVMGGYFAKLIIEYFNSECKTLVYTKKIGEVVNEEVPKDFSQIGRYGFCSDLLNKSCEKFLLKAKSDGESYGGLVNIIINNPPIGLGEPVFDKIKADFAKAFLSIGACVGFSYGHGHQFDQLKGSEVASIENAFGGMEGGITNGETINMSLIFKPTSTIKEKAKAGRHDPCIIPRALVVVESMANIVLADHLLRQRAYSWQ